MKKNEIRYSVKQGFVNLLRHPLLLFSSVTTLTLMLFLLSTFVAVSLNASHLAKILGQQPPIEIMMEPGIDQEAIDDLTLLLNDHANVIEIRAYSAEENFETFKKNIGKEEIFNEDSYVDNFPSTFNIRLDDPSLAEEFKEQIMAERGVFTVSLEHELMSFLDRTQKTLNTVGVVVFLVLALVSSLVVANMVRVAALSRATEINIMKYVGATDGYVRIPFLIEGAMAGLLGALFGTLISGIVYNQLQNVVAGSATTDSLASQLQLLPTSRIVGIMLILNIATGVILSMTASFLALRRHVKV
ncbi:MAG: cell division protein FtsX [Saccharofermentanales bacterium]|jgi:cell division transport system permease protein